MNPSTRKYYQVGLLIGYLLLLIAPGYVFFASRGGLLLLQGLDLASLNSLFFPLFGLYAFTLIALQLLIGANMRRLRPIYSKIMNFHRYQGLAAFTLVLIHPGMVLATFGLKRFLDRSVVSSSLAIFIVPAWLALAIIPVTVITAVLAWKFGRLTAVWRFIHYSNYLAFGLVWVHSWFIGSDIQSTPLKYIWIFYGLAASLSLALRVKRSIKQYRTS